MGEHLGVVLRPSQRLDPLGRVPVLLGAVCPRDLAVGDVAKEDVSEGVLGLACDRGAGLLHELLSLQGEEQLLALPV